MNMIQHGEFKVYCSLPVAFVLSEKYSGGWSRSVLPLKRKTYVTSGWIVELKWDDAISHWMAVIRPFYSRLHGT